jgi:hypothetical protein
VQGELREAKEQEFPSTMFKKLVAVKGGKYELQQHNPVQDSLVKRPELKRWKSEDSTARRMVEGARIEDQLHEEEINLLNELF